jgi:N-succinyldiaminopimelate aminotransferase
MNIKQLQALIALADKYDFIIAGDECYSELYFDEARPPMQAYCKRAAQWADMISSAALYFIRLSKRSNLPGLRSGFVGGDATILTKFLAVPHLPRLRHASATPTRQHCCVE